MEKWSTSFSRLVSQSIDSPDWHRQQEHWVQDVTGLMAVVILISAGLITLGTLAGIFPFPETLPIYVLLVLILPSWWVAKRGAWRRVRHVPMLLCFFLGVYSSINSGFVSIFVLFYALSILLAGMLFSSKMGFLMVLVSTLTYTGIGVAVSGFSAEVLPDIITFFFGLVGISLLQGYFQSRLILMLTALVEGNESLKAEMARRQQAEKTQSDQETQLRRLAEHTTDLVAEIDAEGILRYVSPSYKTTLGYDPEALLGTNAFDMVHPEDRSQAVETASYNAAHGIAGRLQMRVQHSDGHYLYIEASGSPFYARDGMIIGFVLSSRDIDLQKQAEFAIQESERKFRNIIESLPLGIHMYSLHEDGSLVFSGFNPAANAILGTDHAQLIGKPIEAAFPGLAETQIPERYRQIARSGGQWNEEQVDYSTHPIRGAYEVHAFQTSPGKMVAVFADISQRIQADEALRASEEKFSTAFTTSPDSVNINRLSDGVYIDINQGFTRLTGYTREDVIGKSSLELNIWDNPADRSRLVKGLQEKGEVENLEARFRRKNGDVAIALMSARIISVEGEKCILSITRDITERIQSEIALREAHLNLEQAYEATLAGWARALEMREHETAQHSQRVVEQAAQVAQALKIDGDDLAALRRGALLHDIGKMAIPDGILLKPGALTQDEWVIMRQHAALGKDMLNDIEYLRPSVAIPYSHHEKWDGSGYPQGLKGEEIPLPARIFAVVDVYDALTNSRPYRPAWPAADARRYLVDQRGRHFDPQIVDLFLLLVP